MKPYSIDFRQKILEVYTEGNLSQRQLAQHFRVSLSFVQKLLKQYRETGTIAPKVRNQQTPPKLNAEGLDVLREIVQTNNDATLEEIRNLLALKTGVLMGISTLHICHLKLTLKKNITRNGERNRESSTATFRFLGDCAEY